MTLNYLKVVAATLRRDIKGFSKIIQWQKSVSDLQKRNATVPLVFTERVAKNPSKIMFYDDVRNFTYQDADYFSNQVANFITRQGIKKGDDVALFMNSSPEFVMLWLGLSKAGIVSALVNNNLKLDTLAHSVNVVDAKAIIFDYEHREAVADVMPLLHGKKIKYFMLDEGDSPKGASSIRNDLDREDKTFTLVPGNFTDKLAHIYTSGTTGFPKAVIIKHYRYFSSGLGVKYMANTDEDDILYTCLPLHHFAGGIMGTSQTILTGTPMVVRSKFSATNYWEDCKRFNATVGQYIGELCRYLYAQPESPADTDHKLRLMFGNGMRRDLWVPFQSRFKIPQIAEVYGSSEGNAQIANIDNTPGACGFISRILPWSVLRKIYPVAIIKVDPETGQVVRDENGLCVACKPGEVGQCIARIIEGNPVRSFDGYSNEEATKRKIIKDIFAKGEMAFASGDLLVMDEYGYVFFHDRTGDTYRWKAENVSTTEVETVIMKETLLGDCVVYGVEIPGYEGKAGMATIQDTAHSVDVNDLLERLIKILPEYAIPVFMRITSEIELTATLKLSKTNLRKEGFDPSVVKDPLWYYDKKAKKYKKLEKKAHEEILSGKIAF